MTDHIKNRDTILKALREELVGPCPLGDEIDCSTAIHLNDSGSAYRPYKQLGTGEEILQRDSPTKRYGVGVLYPIGVMEDEDDEEEPSDISATEDELDDTKNSIRIVTESAEKDWEKIVKRSEHKLSESDSDDLDLSTANTYKPSSMAVSMLVHLRADSKLVVVGSGGRYSMKSVTLLGMERQWWLRSPIHIKNTYYPKDISEGVGFLKARDQIKENLDDFNLRVEVYARHFESTPDTFLITVCLINRESASGRMDLKSIFQSHIKITVESEGQEKSSILPYPTGIPLDSDERSQELLYRNRPTFAVGHGCAADWVKENSTLVANTVTAESLPVFETPPVTPDILDSSQMPLTASMRSLAGFCEGSYPFEELERIVQEYEHWIAREKVRISELEEGLVRTAIEHMEKCDEAAIRMYEGLDLLKSNPQCLSAFKLANQAMLIQQLRTRREARVISFDENSSSITFEEPYPTFDMDAEGSGKVAWRAFQIAFILMSIRSTASDDPKERSTVELIWFPTGGGKTEAYLGLAAFSIFLRRLKDSTDTGVHVLMRYTLRLLTAQQFQRAARLICAMEYVRKNNVDRLGDSEISIGIWLGGSTTPNSRSDALSVLRSLIRADGSKENLFVLDRCPWCGAQMGPIKLRAGRHLRNRAPKVVGYTRRGGTVVYTCPDNNCEFHASLPLYVIDEDIYEHRPDLVIGTVDKFAMLAWRPEARSLFGIAKDGNRTHSPPGIIIQDELHLISGPLGSMVGLYEPIIEELCTDRRNNITIKPKIVSSTATIRNYPEQIKGLYARENAFLFPPPGLDADDSFFARLAREPGGEPKRGRIFIGVHAPGLGSLQTVQVRTFSSLLQAPQDFSAEEKDPWWTLLLFFNSLRELGTTLTLFQSDIPGLLKGALKQRLGIDFSGVRKLKKLLELTGRLPGDEIPKAISALEVPTNSQQGFPVDVCLASNIIEVGVDIDRLSLMTVVGQPKTTSQYIQVTGRVGRRSDRPGLIVTIYSASKPRDRSHFEKFRSYHEKLYAQVEPTSVTPFSRPALDRAVHAVISSYVRQAGSPDQAESPYPFPNSLVEEASEILLSRAKLVDPDELTSLKRVIQRRIDEWERWKRLKWQGALHDEDMPLLRAAGAYVTQEKAQVSWATPQSLRNVDAECQVEITQLYLLEESEEEDA